jgi:hypothetical protein
MAFQKSSAALFGYPAALVNGNLFFALKPGQ